MKKIHLLTIAILLTVNCLMVSCSTNDENNLPADELLNGTEWKHGKLSNDERLYPDGPDVPEVEAIDEFSEHFPNVTYTKGEMKSTVRCDTVRLSGELYGAKLTFSGNRCILYEEEYEDLKVTKIECNVQTTTYVEQSHTSVLAPYYSMKVTKDAIIVYVTNPYTGYQSSSIYRSLQNFQYTASWENELSTEYETLIHNQSTETFNYQRTEDELILTNANKKWIGTLDTDNWTLSFVQVAPEKKDIPTFSLK